MENFGGGFWQWLMQYGPGWGAAILVGGFVFWLVLSGRLVPKSWVDKIFESSEKQAEALKTYSDAWPQIAEYMRTNNHVLTEIQKAREDGGSS